jgi:hypothetical protein
LPEAPIQAAVPRQRALAQFAGALCRARERCRGSRVNIVIEEMLTRECHLVGSGGRLHGAAERWGSQMDNDLVTDAARVSRALSEGSTSGECAGDRAAAKRPKGRLEDVEKIVRQHDREIDALVEAVCELMAKLDQFGVSFGGPSLD